MRLLDDGKFEDTVLVHDDLPELELTPKGLEQYSHLYGDCIELSEFLFTFSEYLQSKPFFSAKALLLAMLNGYEGYYSVTALIFVAFLHAFKTYKVLDVSLSDIYRSNLICFRS